MKSRAIVMQAVPAGRGGGGLARLRIPAESVLQVTFLDRERRPVHIVNVIGVIILPRSRKPRLRRLRNTRFPQKWTVTLLAAAIDRSVWFACGLKATEFVSL
jgi:hypothetical protein